MKASIQVLCKAGHDIVVELVKKGEPYALAMTHDKAEPLVTFLNWRTMQTVSTYYLSTILATPGGLCLDGSERGFDIEHPEMEKIRHWLKHDVGLNKWAVVLTHKYGLPSTPQTKNKVIWAFDVLDARDTAESWNPSYKVLSVKEVK